MALSDYFTIVAAVLAVVCSLRAADGFEQTKCDAKSLLGHGKVAQSSKSPYQIVLSQNLASSKVRVMLVAPKPKDYYVGFLLEGRALGSGKNAIGSFVKIPLETRTLDCDNAPRSGVMNSSNITKKYVEFDWEAPSDFEGQVNFVATVVIDHATFWNNITSIPVQIKSPGDGQLRMGQKNQEEAGNELKEIEANIYTGCGKNKNCVAAPLGCIKSKNCQAIVALIPSDDSYQFEMLAYGGSKYVAFGLSHDNKMGDDGVIECARQTNYGIESASVYKSRNVPGRRQNRRVEGSAGVTLERAVVVDDAIYCEVTLDHVLKIEENTYDLDRDDYYFLLAAGTSLKDSGVGFHDVAFTSSDDKWRFGQLRSATRTAHHPFYDECGQTKTCLGSPNGCVSTKDCVAAASVRSKGAKYLFEMMAKTAAVYVAAGISNDKKMGNDSVMECVHDVGKNSINAYMSWNIPNKKANKRLTNQNGLRLLNTSAVDGIIYCAVERDAVTKVEGVEYNLIKNKYVLLLAAGTSLKERSVGFHDLAYTLTGDARPLSEIKSSKF